MGKKDSAPEVGMVRIEVPDADERLRRAFDLVLRAAARVGPEVAQGSDSGQDGHRGGVDHGTQGTD